MTKSQWFLAYRPSITTTTNNLAGCRLYFDDRGCMFMAEWA